MMLHRLTRRWHALVVLCLWGTNLSYVAAQTPNPGTSLLGGWAYVDRNNDGVLAFDDATKPEFSIPNVTINLYALNNNVETLLSTKLTDEFGRYFFENLSAGTYAIKQVQPVDFVDGKDTLGALESIFANQPLPGGSNAGSAGNNLFSGIVLPLDVQGDGYNFGERGMTAFAASKRYLLGSTPSMNSPPPPTQSQIPEPSTLLLMASAAGGAWLLGRRRARTA
jgi:SdrD B-like domain/PEP-CTERM motif